MKWKKRIGALLLTGAMMTAVGSQAFAYSWSGYIGYNQWTAVANTKTATGSPWASWTGSEGKSKGCQVGFYNVDGQRVGSASLTCGGGSQKVSADIIKGRSYSLKAKLTSDSSYGIYNEGSWSP